MHVLRPAALLGLREQEPAAAYGLISWVDFPLRHAVAAAAGLGLDVVALHQASFGPTGSNRGRCIATRRQRGGGAPGRARGARLVPEAEAAGLLVAAGVDALCLNDVPTAVPTARAGW